MSTLRNPIVPGWYAEPGCRILCIDRMEIGEGGIKPVQMTDEWKMA